MDFAELTRWLHFASFLGAVAVGVGVFAVGELLVRGVEQWRRRFLEEAEMELQEMLMQMPAVQVLHYSLLAAAALAVLAFVLLAPGRDRFNWQFGLTAAAGVFVTAMILSRSVLKWLRQQRLGKFNDQLEEALLSMSNALKAGFSINQAVEMVVKQNNNPISLEFKLMIQQTQLGMSFDDALRNMARRVQSEDFTLVASAISTARQTGGDLTGVFARLAAMIRERLRIQRRIRVLTAQGRLQGTVLGLLPMALLAILYFFVDPELVRNFFGSPIGLVLFGVVVVLEVCGYLVIRKIVTIDI